MTVSAVILRRYKVNEIGILVLNKKNPFLQLVIKVEMMGYVSEAGITRQKDDVGDYGNRRILRNSVQDYVLQFGRHHFQSMHLFSSVCLYFAKEI